MASGSSGNSLLKGRWTIWILAFIFALLAGFGVLTILGTASEQSTYYVMAETVPAGTKLTESNIEQRTTSADGVPPTALSLSQLQAEPLFTNIPLKAGDVITSSVVGTGIRITAGLPPNYVAASLEIEPKNAAAGKIRAGDLVDIAAVQDGESKVVLHNVLVLDVNTSPRTIAQAANDEQAGNLNNASLSGVPSLYTFALSPEDFAKMALLRSKDVYLAISQGAPGTIDASARDSEIFTPGPADNAAPVVIDDTTVVVDDTVVPEPPREPAETPAR